MPGLIVSVRDAREASIALENGASLIDVKEPTRGALGRADDSVIEAVTDAVAGRLPVSAALGEAAEELAWPACAGRLAFVKMGLAGMRHRDWLGVLAKAKAVPCAYADWKRAGSPRVSEVFDAVRRLNLPGLLLDTWEKDGTTLLDWIPEASLSQLADRCRLAGVKLALAGSLTGASLDAACAAAPTWVAVRGAVCEGGRGGTISPVRVRAVSSRCLESARARG